MYYFYSGENKEGSLEIHLWKVFYPKGGGNRDFGIPLCPSCLAGLLHTDCGLRPRLSTIHANVVVSEIFSCVPWSRISKLSFSAHI